MLVDISRMPVEKEVSLAEQIKHYLKRCYWAGADLCRTGTSLDCMSMENDIENSLLELATMMVNLRKRNTALVTVVKDLLEQHRRQDDVEACSLWQSYPTKFPEWDRAWENAAKVLFEGD